METRMVVARAQSPTVIAFAWGKSTIAPSPVLPMVMCTATGARIRPITMITGPVTTGGSTRLIMSLPCQRTSRLSRIYTTPAAARPHMVPGMPQVLTP